MSRVWLMLSTRPAHCTPHPVEMTKGSPIVADIWPTRVADAVFGDRSERKPEMPSDHEAACSWSVSSTPAMATSGNGLPSGMAPESCQ